MCVKIVCEKSEDPKEYGLTLSGGFVTSDESSAGSGIQQEEETQFRRNINHKGLFPNLGSSKIEK